MQRDIGAARLKVDLPAEARAYVYDNALVPTQWDLTNAAWLARIEEGVRFGFSSIATARIEVQAEDDPAIRFKGRRMVPAYDEVTRIENVALDTTLNISQLVHTNTTLVRKEASRIRITYGPTQWACENVAGWAGLGGDARPGQMLTVNGETFEVVYQGANYGPGHQTYGVRQLRYELYSEPYWEYVTEGRGRERLDLCAVLPCRAADAGHQPRHQFRARRHGWRCPRLPCRDQHGRDAAL